MTKTHLFFLSSIVTLFFTMSLSHASSSATSSATSSVSSSMPCINPYWFDETRIMDFLKRIDIDDQPSGLPGVDCIYLINLDRRPERLARMQHILKEYGLHAQRMPAVDGKTLSDQAKQALLGPYHMRMTNGAIGCLLSHLSILYDAYTRGFQCIWILEDDVCVRDDPQVLAPLLEALYQDDPNWDLFFTDVDAKNAAGYYVPASVVHVRPGQPAKPLSYYQQKQRVGSYFFRVWGRFGTWSMCVSRNGMKKLLDYYQHVYLWSAYDVDLFYTPNLRSYTTCWDIVTQWLESSSDTQ